MSISLHAKILVTGDASVGKTSLISRFVNNKFEEEHVYTMGVDFSQAECKVADRNVLLELRDTAGQERFRAITSSVYRGANGMIVAYDITDEESFNHVSYWLKIAKETTVEDIPIIIIGNKSDRVEDRQVSRERGQVLAINEGTLFMEVSAKENIRVHDCFVELVKRIIAMEHSFSARSERSPTIRLDATHSRIYSQFFNSESSTSIPGSRISAIFEDDIQQPNPKQNSPMAYLCC